MDKLFFHIFQGLINNKYADIQLFIYNTKLLPSPKSTFVCRIYSQSQQ